MNARFVTWRRLGRPQMWGLPLLIMAAWLFAVLTLLFDSVLLDDWSLWWVFIYFATLAEVVALAFIVNRFVLVHINMVKFGAPINVAVAGFLGAIKNVSVGFIATNVGLELDPMWSFRILGGFGLGIGVFIFSGIAVGARVEHNAMMAELADVQRELLELRSNSRARLREANDYLANSTRETLLPKLEKLQALIGKPGETASAIEGLKRLIRDDVRPLSESLSVQAAKLVSQPEPKLATRKRYSFFQPKVQLSKLLRPNATFFSLAASFWMVSFMIVSAPRVNDVAIATLGSWLILWFAKLMIPLEVRVSGRTAFFVLLFIVGVATLPPFLMGLSLSSSVSQGSLFGSFFLIAGITVMSFAFAEGLDLDRTQARRQLQQENDDLAHDVALFEQQLWLGRRAWQFVVHGTVQAALTAALTRLQSAPSLDEETLTLIDQDLARARTALAEQPEREVDLDESFAQIKSTWKGICDIDTYISKNATAELKANQDARLCVNEIVKECVSNGIRHGNATIIRVEIDIREDDGLDIKVTNDGIPVKSKTQKGVGSQLIEELTTSWSIATDKASELTVFQANLPLIR